MQLIELPLNELIELTFSTDLRRLIKKYKLDAKFCVERVLFDDTLTGEDTYICTNDILRWQPHISEEELLRESREFFRKQDMQNIHKQVSTQ